MAAAASGTAGCGGTGGPTFDIDLKALQVVNTGNVGGIEFAVTPVTTSGRITVTYLVPEPSSALLALCASGVVMIRRRRA